MAVRSLTRPNNLWGTTFPKCSTLTETIQDETEVLELVEVLEWGQPVEGTLMVYNHSSSSNFHPREWHEEQRADVVDTMVVAKGNIELSIPADV